jgi:hypothetical protein
MTTEERLETLEKELAREKRRARWLLALVALVVGVGVFCASTGTAKEIRASKFTLLDQNGKDRAILAVDETEPGLIFFDEQGKPRARLVVKEKGPEFSFLDQQGTTRVRLSMLSTDGPELVLRDEQDELQFMLTAPPEIGPNSAMYQNKEVIWHAP